MKSFLQVAVPIIILMAIVGLVAYITQSTNRTVEKPIIDKTPTPPTDEPLVFDDSYVEPDANTKPIEVEYHSFNHKDYWFHTNVEGDVSVALNHKSCTCTNVDIITFGLTPAEWDKLRNGPTLTAAIKLLASQQPPLKVGDLGKNEFQTVRGTKKGETPLPCIMRMNWDAKEAPGESRHLRVRVVARVGNGTISSYDRECGYVVVPTIGVAPQLIDIGELLPNGRREATVYVWSLTRPQLNFQARLTLNTGMLPPDEPCAEVGSPVELSETERQQLPAIVGDEKLKIPPVAYKLTFALHERRGEHQLELGPLVRRLTFAFQTSDTERHIDDFRVSVSATVRGEVNVLSGDENGRVDLGTYKYDRARKFVVRLGADNPALELEVESTSDPKINASLKPAKIVNGRKEWDMDVEIEPNFVLGNFPTSTLVVLKTKGPNPRRLRIPLTGKTDR